MASRSLRLSGVLVLVAVLQLSRLTASTEGACDVHKGGECHADNTTDEASMLAMKRGRLASQPRQRADKRAKTRHGCKGPKCKASPKLSGSCQEASCAFDVYLQVKDKATGNTKDWGGWQYGYVDDRKAPPYPCEKGGCLQDWVSQAAHTYYTDMGMSGDEAVQKARFMYVETIQYILNDADADQPRSIFIYDLDGANCVGAYYKDRFLGFYGADGSEIGLDAPGDGGNPIGVGPDEPVHMSFFFFNINGGSCADGPPDGSLVDANRGLAVFMSKYQNNFSPTVVVDDGTCPGPRYGCMNGCAARCAVEPPYWSKTNIGGDDYLVFQGSMVDFLQDQGGADVTIKVQEGSTVQLPMNNLLARAKIASGSCDLGADGNVRNCQIYKFELVTLGYPGFITIGGFGRISGANIWKNSDLADYGHGLKDGVVYDMEKTQIQDSMKYYVYSGLLVLSSSKQNVGDQAVIDISGISVVYGPKRFGGAVQLNSAYAQAVSSIDEACCDAFLNKWKVHAFDFKVVANWMDAVDCMEIMGYNSDIEHAFCHTNDDSIKLSAPGVSYYETTVFQGNTGSAVALGAYGKNRGTAGAGAYGVYVHRVTQNTLDGTCKNNDWNPKTKDCDSRAILDATNGYDGFNGLVASRTCPQVAIGGSVQDTGLMDITVERLFVNNFGWVNGNAQATINSVAAVFSFGINAYGDFCDPDTFLKGSPYPVSQVTFKDWQIYTEPSWPSLIYNYPKGVDAEWTQRDAADSAYALYTGKEANYGDAANPDWRPLKPEDGGGITIWKYGSLDSEGYWVCAPGTDVGTYDSSCWATTSNSAAPVKGAKANTDYGPSDVGNSIRFPY